MKVIIRYNTTTVITLRNQEDFKIRLAANSGLPGLPGPPGPSAYELAVTNGYVGTLPEWIASLEGADGLSAYEVAVANGFIGTEIEWVNSLIGSDGASAYQVALDNGFVGTVEEWLLSLEGTDGIDGVDGVDGISAYQVAVNNGFVGTEAEWLTSLEGTDGNNGDSAYQIALNNGFVGTEAEWLASLEGADGVDATVASGTRAARPASGAYVGQLYSQTDELVGLYYWNGAIWEYQLDGAEMAYGIFVNQGMSPLTAAANGTGAGQSQVSDEFFGALLTGSTSTGRAHWYMNRNFLPRAGHSYCLAFSSAHCPILPNTATDDFYVRWGAGVSNNSQTYFHIQGNNLFFSCVSNLVTTVTSVPFVANQKYNLVILVRVDVDVRFYIDGVLVATHGVGNGTIIANQNLGSPGMHINKLAGLNSRDTRILRIIIKYMQYQI